MRATGADLKETMPLHMGHAGREPTDFIHRK